MSSLLMEQTPQDALLHEALSRGARAGVVSQCQGRKSLPLAQIENMMSIVGEYKYPISFKVLLLYIAYQAGRGYIHRKLAKTMTDDLMFLEKKVSEVIRNTDRELDPNEVLRSYLGAMKWVATAIYKGGLRFICWMVNGSLPSDVNQIVAALFGLHGGRR